MQQTYVEVTSEVDVVVKEQYLLKFKEQNVAEEIELSNQMLAFANDDVEKGH